jgi:hypothetical protein
MLFMRYIITQRLRWAMIWHMALPPLCWTVTMPNWGRLGEVATDQALMAPRLGSDAKLCNAHLALLVQHIMRSARRHG